MEHKAAVSTESIFQLIKIYLLQYKKYKLYTFLSFLFPAIGGVLIFYIPPYIISKTLNYINNVSIIDWNIIYKNIFLFGLSWTIGEMCYRLAYHFLTKLEGNVRQDLFEYSNQKILERDYNFFANNFTGSLVKKLNSFVNNFESLTDLLAFNILSNIIPMFFAFYILIQYSIFYVLIFSISIFIAVMIAIPIIRKRKKLVIERYNSQSILTGMTSDSLSNIMAIKAFANEEIEIKELNKQSEDYNNKWFKSSYFQTWRYDVLISPIYIIINVLGIFLSFYLFKIGKIELGEIFLAFSYFALMSRIVWEINNIYRTFEDKLVDASEFIELIKTAPKITDSKNAKPLSVLNGKIEFKNVYFKYNDNAEKYLFEDFNLIINRGEKIGLVGSSGGGKTTITKLLLRFLDTNKGKILFDEENIKKVTQKSLRKSIAYVPQEPLLFHRSIYENIAYGLENIKREDVESVAKMAHAHDFIMESGHGYETLVGERGIKLSGGQKQRIAIARAMLRNNKIVILDEATSALDSESEKFIQESLFKLIENKTAIIVAHRLSTIKKLDRILVLENGKIVEDGNHKELIKADGVYAKLWSHQTGDILE